MPKVDTDWLNARKKELKLSDESLGRAIGRDRSMANKMINGAIPFDVQHLAGLSNAFKVLPEELLFRFGVLETNHAEPQASPPRPPVIQSDTLPTRNVVEGSVSLRHVDMSLSMGDGTNIDDYFEEGVFEFDAGLLRGLSRAPSHRLIVARGVGDSMTPTIHEDAMVIFDTTLTDLNVDDKIWAVSVYGAGGIKRLQKVASNRVLVISDNPLVPNKEVSTEDLRIIGRVIWSARRH